MNNDVITLVTVVGYTEDSSGFKTAEMVEEIEVFAGIKSVGRTEFYEALRNGVKASIIFVINQDDFKLADRDVSGKKVKATKIVHEKTTYRIIRTYMKDINMLEITCEEVE